MRPTEPKENPMNRETEAKMACAYVRETTIGLETLRARLVRVLRELDGEKRPDCRQTSAAARKRTTGASEPSPATAMRPCATASTC